jgi:hypothetical protein
MEYAFGGHHMIHIHKDVFDGQGSCFYPACFVIKILNLIVYFRIDKVILKLLSNVLVNFLYLIILLFFTIDLSKEDVGYGRTKSTFSQTPKVNLEFLLFWY